MGQITKKIIFLSLILASSRGLSLPAKAAFLEEVPETLEGPVDDEAEAAANLSAFKEHFDGLLAGHAEGLFMSRCDHCPIYPSGSEDNPIAAYLEKGEPVHVISLQGEWAQIGYKRFVQKKHIQSCGAKTIPKP